MRAGGVNRMKPAVPAASPLARILVAAFILVVSMATVKAETGAEGVVAPGAAAAALSSPEVRSRSAALFQRTREAAVAVSVLDAHADDPTLDPVRRDAVLHDFIQRLRRAGPGSLSREALDWLKSYRPRAKRVHEESVSTRVPLFNIPAEAAGLENQWRFESGRDDLLRAGPDRLAVLLEQFVDDPGGPRAAGMRSALPDMPAPALERLAALAEDHPAASATALYPSIEWSLGRIDRVAAWVAQASAQPVTEFLLQAGRGRVPVPIPVHRAALDHPDAAVRAQAMAGITEALSGDADRKRAWIDELAARLAEPEAGAAAALQLARIGSGDALKALQARAAKGDLDPVAARRIELIRRLRRTVSDPASPEGPKP